MNKLFISAVLVSILALPSVAMSFPTGLVGYWSGETNGNDSSGHNHHAQLQNGAQAGLPGLVGGAFLFDGIDDFAETPVTLTEQGTINLWVNPVHIDGGVNGIIGTPGIAVGADRLWISFGGDSIGNRWVINLGSGSVDDINVPGALSIGEWTHLALTFDYLADEYLLYVNGVLAASSFALRDVPTQSLEFGGFHSNFGQNFFFNGLIDEVTLFDRVLNPTEIQGMFNFTQPIPEPSTMLLLGSGLVGLIGYRMRKSQA